ncbi:unnamed protein product [Blepharisma stoltei]|uniref:Uncharacterized protein n=1 Tax=Blepharisma stoltei TaxID=1481888 RepID=A0AAU9INC7_9CILI|nr:unnamed protein product [Blepharisma stoltei]
MISENIRLVTFKINEVNFKPNVNSDTIPKLCYTLCDPITSQVIFSSFAFELSEVSSLAPIHLQPDISSSLILNIYMKTYDDPKLLGSEAIDLIRNIPLKTQLNFPSEYDENFNIEIEISEKESPENPSETIQENGEMAQEKEKYEILQIEKVNGIDENSKENENMDINEIKNQEKINELDLNELNINKESIEENENEQEKNELNIDEVSKLENKNEQEISELNTGEENKLENKNEQEINELGIVQVNNQENTNVQEINEFDIDQMKNQENKNEQEMNELLRIYEIDDISNIAEKIEEAKEEVLFYHKRKKFNEEESAKNKLIDLERLLQLSEEIKAAKENKELKQNESAFEEENLEEELKKGLIKFNIKNPENIEEMINKTKTSISHYLNSDKIDKANSKKIILADLEKLLCIYKRINLKTMITIDPKEAENQKNIDFLEGMINHISSIPYCMERFLTSILCFAYYKVYNLDEAEKVNYTFIFCIIIK